MSISRRNFLRGAGTSVSASLALTVAPTLTADAPAHEAKTETRTLLHWRDRNMAGYEWVWTYRLACTSGVFRIEGEQEVIGDGEYRLIREREGLLTGQQICGALGEIIHEDNLNDDAFDRFVALEAADQVAWFGRGLARDFLRGYIKGNIGLPVDRDELIAEGYDEIVAMLDSYS